MSKQTPIQWIRLALLFPLLAGGGCQSDGSLKRWGGTPYGQGSIDRQKARAVTVDPYPLNDIGPEVVGGRPRDFANPMPEASRNELNPKLGIFSRFWAR